MLRIVPHAGSALRWYAAGPGAGDSMGDRSIQRIPSPPSFTGDVAALADFVVANVLPTPRAVDAFHAALCRYCELADPLFVIRAPGSAREMRGSVVATADACRVRFSDNAPAWQVHHTLFHERLRDIVQFEQFIEALPTHFFEVTKRVPDSVNSAGWYVAHVLPVGDRREFAEWRRTDVRRRFVRNIHPCNLFFVPKEHGRALGENPAVIAHFAARLRALYSSAWDGFHRLAGADATQVPEATASALFVPVASICTPTAISSARTPARASPSGPTATAPAGTRNEHTGAAATARYSFSRLCFKRDIIEPLADDQQFEVVTPDGTFRMTKREFQLEFPNVVASASYRDGGVYHFPKVPAKATKYLVPAE